MNLMSRNIVLGVLALVLAIPTFLQLRADADTFIDIGRIPLMFQGFTSDNAGAVLIAQPRAEQPKSVVDAGSQQVPLIDYDQLVLQLVDSTWRVGQLPDQPAGKLVGAPIVKSRLEADVFHHLRMIRSDPETLVQSNASEEQLRKYGLDAAHAYLIKVVDKKGENVLAEVYVGDDSSVGQSGTDAVRGVFVRQVGSNDVVLYEWEKPWRRDIEINGWLERVLARIEPNKVRKLSIKNLSTRGKTFVFEREPGKSLWLSKDGSEDLGAVRQSEIEGLIQRFRYLSVEGFDRSLSNAGNLAAFGLGPPAIEVGLIIDQGGALQDVRIEVGKRLDGRNVYYMTCSLVPFIMTWTSSMVAHFDLDVAQRLFDPK